MAANNFTTITIDNIDISNYSEYYVINHITKKEEPKRTINFALSNINDINQVEIPEIFIKFKYLPIALYREIFKATRKAEFKVVYYDQDYDMMRTNMFYLKESSSINPHSWGASRFTNKNKAFLGFKDYNLNLVCTMNPISDVDISLSEFLGSSYLPLQKPFIIETNREDGGITLNFKIISLENQALSGDIIVSFTNDKIKISDLVDNAGKYTLTCATSGSNYTIDAEDVEQAGEYVMFMTINNLEYNYIKYGSITISVRIILR